MRCKNCGFEFPDGSEYCPNCGTHIDEVTYEQTVIEPEINFGGDNSERRREDPFENNSGRHEDPFGGESSGRSNENPFGRMYCSNCGAPVNPNSQYCLNCGARIGGFGDSYRPRKVGFLEAYRLYWKNIVDFKHRASMSEFWYFVLWDLLIGVVLGLLQDVSGFTEWYSALLGGVSGGGGEEYLIFQGLLINGNSFLLGQSSAIPPFALVVMILTFAWELANLLPSLSILVRRLHDTGKSALYLFWILLPLAGWIIILIALLTRSQNRRNQYDG